MVLLVLGDVVPGCFPPLHFIFRNSSSRIPTPLPPPHTSPALCFRNQASKLFSEQAFCSSHLAMIKQWFFSLIWFQMNYLFVGRDLFLNHIPVSHYFFFQIIFLGVPVYQLIASWIQIHLIYLLWENGSGPFKVFLFTSWHWLLVSRGHWRNMAEGKGFASWFPSIQKQQASIAQHM